MDHTLARSIVRLSAAALVVRGALLVGRDLLRYLALKSTLASHDLIPFHELEAKTMIALDAVGFEVIGSTLVVGVGVVLWASAARLAEAIVR